MMPIRSLGVRGYRSVQRMHLPLAQVNVIVGPNGCGKTNLYRSLYLLNMAANGRLARVLAEEGGMPSCLWAGEVRKGTPKRIAIEVQFDAWRYQFACGLADAGRSAFDLDPYVREEELQFLDGVRRATIFQRRNRSCELRDDSGERVKFPFELSDSESILSELREPSRFPELSELRAVLSGWRFYHQFRSDAESPLRRPQIGVRTPVLSHDGSDLAAALATILEIGDHEGLKAAVQSAFPGASLLIQPSSGGIEVALILPQFRREFSARELSDGTIKYLCLLATLLSPRPPSLLALNEPDANMHPQLFDPLARMIGRAARDSQLWITTHSELLAGLLREHAAAHIIRLEMIDGATVVSGAASELEVEDDNGDD
ncbi:MAG: AAA family ATPase [Pirellulales bacterium]